MYGDIFASPLLEAIHKAAQGVGDASSKVYESLKPGNALNKHQRNSMTAGANASQLQSLPAARLSSVPTVSVGIRSTD
ncbi:hypothetical protein CSOJ01_02773 [Colletotrichum sojae]|uniref:Uncharacterized protein n=1 Tax=Colletotrichum sojae TaxID=2175907 RepID=A0A8H6N1G0_9PEZI|nr:hypothetical protein CSOJ01_02773 [Colletotrichum sojae]